MEDSYNPQKVQVDYDPNELRAELEKAAATIGEEIKHLEEATRVTRKVLRLEFTI